MITRPPTSHPASTPTPAPPSAGTRDASRPRGFPAPSALAGHWRLDPDTVFLNHGSYGACPAPVLEAQRRIRDRMEAEPVRFFMIDLEKLADAARARIASFVGARDPQALALTPNATIAVATVIRNTRLEPGDEVLVNDHEYMSCISEFHRHADRHGYAVKCAEVPFPVRSPDEVFEAVMAQVTPRTKLALLSEITSPTAIVFPIPRLVRALKDRGVTVLVDGAHTPGQRALDVESLGADYYAGNLHKWVSAPKGSAFLWVAPKHQKGFEPLALSSRAHIERSDRSRFNALFDYVGTNDYSPVLAAPEAIDFLASLLPGGWDELTRRNHELVIEGRNLICNALGVEPPAPDDMLASMASIIIPGLGLTSGGIKPGGYEDPLQARLVEKHRIQVPVWSLPSKGHRILRISAQLYNSREQYAYLAEALKQELAAE